MKKDLITIDGIQMPLVSVNTLIIGSGAAALNAAVQLVEFGQRDIAIVTDHWGGGTSNNAGSDKQTYYKLSLAGDIPDSPLEMARDLFSGGCMHGDIALCEAQHSAQAFYHLVQLGVPFPHDRFGGYAGYKTDHDPRGRGTSAGPLTSHMMFEALARDVKNKAVPVFDHHEVIALLTEMKGGEKHIVGAIALNKKESANENMGFVVFNAVNVILGTGGPAGIYKSSVYPESQTGSTGLALRIGAIAHNLTESQFGLASVKFRWNLSGSYQQVIPRYVSTDQSGNGEREFLNEHFPDTGTMATAIFLKGYQWPFDPRKVAGYGSSLIDLLVYREIEQNGRRVFLDFTRNPSGCGGTKEFSLKDLQREAFEYLEKSDALQDTPIQRLKKMNQPAVDLYRDNGIDLEKEYIEIAVCAQHNNGGLKGNIWWESNIRHLFPIGEVNGSHGVYRPGGSALNAGQVGSLRAAMYISRRYHTDAPDCEDFITATRPQITAAFAFATEIHHRDKPETGNLSSITKEIQERMSRCGAHIRDPRQVKQAVAEAWALYSRLKGEISISSAAELATAFKVLDLCLTHACYLEAINEYIRKDGRSRGSFLVLDPDGIEPCSDLGAEWRFSLSAKEDLTEKKILEISLEEDSRIRKKWVDIRPIPRQDLWFENIWKEFREDNVVR